MSETLQTNIDFKNLGFNYLQTKCFIMYKWKNNQWDQGKICYDPLIKLHIMSGIFHYGQSLFEGLKVYKSKSDNILICNSCANAERMRFGCKRLLMPEITDEMFNSAIDKVLLNNLEYIPPYDSGGSVYIRPFIFASGQKLGLGPSTEYTFIVLINPVGTYYSKKIKCRVIENFDRAGIFGVGNIKMGGNYAACMLPNINSKKMGYEIALYLDPKEHRYIEEFSTSNFIAIDQNGTFVTPKSNSILKGNTNKLLRMLAKDKGINIEVRKIDFNEIKNFKEICACGTAVVLTPIKSITRGDIVYEVPEYNILKNLKQDLLNLQKGDKEDKFNIIRKLLVFQVQPVQCVPSKMTMSSSDVKSKSSGLENVTKESESILSPNFTEADLTEWTNCSLLIPHEPIRSGLNTLIEITDSRQRYYQSQDIYGNDCRWGKQIKMVFQWYNDILYRYVLHHHDAEEAIYFPWLQERTEKLPEKLTKDHLKLVEIMEDIRRLEQTFFDPSRTGLLRKDKFIVNLRELHRASLVLRYSMMEHLNEEELIVPGLLRKHGVTEKEHQVVVDRIISSLGLKGNKIGLPWIIDCMMQWGGPEQVKEFRSGIPWPIRFLNKNLWNSHYIKNNKEIALRIRSIL